MNNIVSRFTLLLVLVLNLHAAPSWYHNLEKKSGNFYIGYGQGSSEQSAKKEALNDISSQISVIIDSSLSSDMGVNDGKSYKNVQDKSSLRSYAQIQGYTVKKLEIDKGQYYIALSYENIPSIDKFNRKLSKVKTHMPVVLNSYLSKTPISKELNKKLDFSLKRKDGLWYIKYKNIYQALDSHDFSNFFTSTTNKKLSITTSKANSIMHNGDTFFFKLLSKQDGYVTIFTVYEDGTVAKLMSNIVVRKNKLEHIPDEEFESVLQAGLIEEGKETFDLYVVVFSQTKKYYDRFASADEELIEDERYKNFDALISLIDTMDYVTLKLVTKPR